MKLLFVNALKGLKYKKIQMLAVILMVLLSSGIYVSMNVAIDRLEDRYYNYLDQQNVENLAFDVKIDLDKLTVQDIEKCLKGKELTSEEQQAISMYAYYKKMNQPLPKEMRYYITSILKKYEVDLIIGSEKLDQIKDKYDFTYEYKRSKTINSKGTLIKVIPYYEGIKIDKPYLVEGKFPKDRNEITILKEFADINGLSINDDYKLGSKKYKIVGFTYAPDYIYPMIDITNPIFDQSKNNIVYINSNNYEEVSGVNDNTYALIFNYKTDRKFEFEKSSNDPVNKLVDANSDIIEYSPNTIVRLMRISALQLEFASDREFAEYFLYLLLGIAVFIIVVITKKRIDDERLQIGVLKSLGYNRYSIASSYLVYPLIGSIIGGLLGYVLGILLHYKLSTLYKSFYVMPLENFQFDYNYLLTVVLLPTIFLSLISYLITIFMLRKKPLQLLKEGSNLKVNFLSKIVNKITSILPFDYRFKYSLASRSVGKLLIVSLTSFSTGLLIVLTLIGMNLFNNMIETSFSGMKYDHLVALNGLDSLNSKNNSDLILSQELELESTIHNDKETKVEDKQVVLNGMDDNLNYFDIKDQEGKDLTDYLVDENAIIINETLKGILKVDVGDKLVLLNDKEKIIYNIVGICEEYTNLSGYVSRTGLSKNLNLADYSYNQFVTKDKKYRDYDNLSKEELDKIGSIISITDLKDNILKQTEKLNSSIYIVIGFASVMALIIIAVIANIVIEENKRTISLMKVIGYDSKRISRIVLNIYTPFVIIAYLLSIPCMIKILKWIIDALVGDINMVIPITLSPKMALLGLLGLVIAYYLAIALSKRVLNKVPLAVALKRE